MGKFWEWMKEKGYAHYDKDIHDGQQFGAYSIKGKDNRWQSAAIPTKQMLIGYMWEYLGGNLSGEVMEMEPKTNEEIVDYMYNMLESKINGL